MPLPVFMWPFHGTEATYPVGLEMRPLPPTKRIRIRILAGPIGYVVIAANPLATKHGLRVPPYRLLPHPALIVLKLPKQLEVFRTAVEFTEFHRLSDKVR